MRPEDVADYAGPRHMGACWEPSAKRYPQAAHFPALFS